MATFILYWRIKGKSREVVQGNDIVDACNKAGIGNGALPALDYYETMNSPLPQNQAIALVSALREQGVLYEHCPRSDGSGGVIWNFRVLKPELVPEELKPYTREDGSIWV